MEQTLYNNRRKTRSAAACSKAFAPCLVDHGVAGWHEDPGMTGANPFNIAGTRFNVTHCLDHTHMVDPFAQGIPANGSEERIFQ